MEQGLNQATVNQCDKFINKDTANQWLADLKK